MLASRSVRGLYTALFLLIASHALAQDPDQPTHEEPDATRLDVERLPVEAIEITRDLYAHGLFVEAMIGGRGFTGGVGRISDPGLYLRLGVGYELFRFLHLKVSGEGSIHATDAPSPPSATVFQLLGFVAELRFQIDFSAAFAVWIGGEAGLFLATNDVLTSYGLAQGDALDLTYGGSLGIDWHLASLHHSLGLFGGARLAPSLDGPDGETAVGIHGGVYMRYVF